MNLDHQTPSRFGRPFDMDRETDNFPTLDELEPPPVGDSTPPATPTLTDYQQNPMLVITDPPRMASDPPATPVERKPTTLELSGTMPDVSHYSRCARCGGSGREEDASHPPAVSGEGERLIGRRRCTIREHRRQIKALQRELASLREGRAALWAAKHAAEREADTLRAEVRLLHASIPTSGAPR